MKLTLIETGGFAGKTKVAQVDVKEFPDTIATELQKYFQEKKDTKPSLQAKQRDNFKYFWDMNNDYVGVQKSELPPELEKLFQSMKRKLKYEK